MTEDSSGLTLPPPAAPTMSTKQRINLHDIRNVDLVQRFLAATPSYLYSPPPIGPPNFFFSEMLRSLVQAKTNESNRNLSNQIRRPRKRLWTPNRFDSEPSTILSKESISNAEKPLELTTKPFSHGAFNSHLTKNAKIESDDKNATPTTTMTAMEASKANTFNSHLTKNNDEAHGNLIS